MSGNLAEISYNGSMEIQIVENPIAISEVRRLAAAQFGDLVKAAVDVDRAIMALGGELHADEEQLLLENGSAQRSLWGINLYPAKFGTPGFIEFDSMINLRPSQNNRTRAVEDASRRQQIADVVGHLIAAEAGDAAS